MNDCCSVSTKKQFNFLKSNLVLIVMGLFVLLFVSFIFPFLAPFREHFLMYCNRVAGAIVLGLVIGGAIDYYIPHEYISAALSKSQKRTIFRAIGLGTLASACSCGILALAIELYRKGASTSAVVAFLLASPWANLPLTIVLIGLFGAAKAFFIIGAAVIIAITTGIIFQFFESRSIVERNPHTVAVSGDFSIKRNLQERFRNYQLTPLQIKKDIEGVAQGTVGLANMVLGWILIGIVLAGAIGAYVPQELLHDYMGPTFGGMVLTLVAATIIEVCSEGTAPLAFELYRQTAALGNSFVFLMAGVVTDYTEIGLLWQNIGRRTAILLPVVTVPQVLIFGFLANQIFK